MDNPLSVLPPTRIFCETEAITPRSTLSSIRPPLATQLILLIFIDLPCIACIVASVSLSLAFNTSTLEADLPIPCEKPSGELAKFSILASILRIRFIICDPKLRSIPQAF